MPRHDPIRVDKPLAEWLTGMVATHPDLFPRVPGVAYDVRYQQITQYLNSHVHPHVVQGAAMVETEAAQQNGESGNGFLYLNDHGVEHIAQVISRASEIAIECEIALQPYEAYLLLLAVHLHDVGNIFGRTAHERKCMEVMSDANISALLGDSTEKRVIAQIASVHGGTVQEEPANKDTIGQLEDSTDLFGFPVRQRFLAALLRFADELADERSRASRFMLANDRLPERSRLYHEYSFSLQSVRVDEHVVRLGFELPKAKLLQRFPDKDGNEVYLMDEIDRRIRKMHRERVYCMRFWPATAQPLRQLDVVVELVDDSTGGALCLERLTCTLTESGYPGRTEGECPLCLPARLLPPGQEVYDKYSESGPAGDQHAQL